MRLKGVVQVALFVLVVQILGASAAEVSPPPAPAAMMDTDAGRQTFALINETRIEQDLPPLAWDDHLAEAAQQHAELLVRNRQLSHQFPDEPPLQQRIANVDVRFGVAGENVAVNVNAKGAHIAFMHSPGHRANILNTDFNSVAIVVVREGDLLYFVEDFAQRQPVLSNSDAAKLLATRFGELRSRTGAQPLQHVDDTRVQDWACEDAQSAKLGTAQGAKLGAAQSISYNTASVDSIPAGLAHLIETPSSVRYALGVCYAKTVRFPNGRYFVAIALFSGGMSLSPSIAEYHLPPATVPDDLPIAPK